MEKRALLEELKGIHCCNCGLQGVEYVYVVPLEYGGNDVIGNIVPMCKSCRAISGRFSWISRQSFKEDEI